MSALLEVLLDDNEIRPPSTDTIRHLLSKGAPLTALHRPVALGVNRVIFDGNGGYVPSPVGEHALILPTGTIESGDLVAWNPVSGKLATRLGLAPVLGIEQINGTENGRTGLPIRVFRSPMGWLKSNRNGVVIVSERLAVALFSGLALEAEDVSHRRELLALVKQYQPQVFVSADLGAKVHLRVERVSA